tara:strand:- start:202 stop:741 length:540 start_codon:yes stop_codon:yes gene_type:complete
MSHGTTGAFAFNFYESEHNPTGLTGLVGGQASSTLLQPKLGYFIADMPIPDVTTLYQFRKFYITQTEDGTFQDLKVSLINVEHSDQITFFVDSGASSEHDSAPNPMSTTVYPTGAYGGLRSDHFSGDYETPIYYTGSVNGATTVSGETFPIWIRQEIDSSDNNDNLASFIVQVSATKLI